MKPHKKYIKNTKYEITLEVTEKIFTKI